MLRSKTKKRVNNLGLQSYSPTFLQKTTQFKFQSYNYISDSNEFTILYMDDQFNIADGGAWPQSFNKIYKNKLYFPR